MKKNKLVIILAIIVIIGAIIGYLFVFRDKDAYSDKRIKLIINAATLEVRLYANETAEAFYNKLNDGHLVIEVSDDGQNKKIGNLTYTMPTNDIDGSMSVGDIVLYEGHKLAVIYGKSTGNMTKIGKIQNTNATYLQNILGQGNVKLEFFK